MSVDTLTHVIYVLIVIVFLAAMAFVVVYSRRQTAALKKAEQNGARPHSTAEAIILGHQQAARDRR